MVYVAVVESFGQLLLTIQLLNVYPSEFEVISRTKLQGDQLVYEDFSPRPFNQRGKRLVKVVAAPSAQVTDEDKPLRLPSCTEGRSARIT
jgi:hypothetical protein